MERLEVVTPIQKMGTNSMSCGKEAGRSDEQAWKVSVGRACWAKATKKEAVPPGKAAAEIYIFWHVQAGADEMSQKQANASTPCPLSDDGRHVVELY